MSSNALNQSMANCVLSTETFCRTLMSEKFARPFSPLLGRKICEAIDDDAHRHTLILAPRSIGKSSIVQAACIRRALFKQSRFIVTVSSSGTLAIEQSENMKNMLTTCEPIKQLFPADAKETEEWAMERWTMENGAHFRPRGFGQQVHGMNHRSKRPDFIVVDDLEDPEHMMSDEYREKVSRWFWQSLYGCFDHSRKDWRIVVIGTMSHEDCILARIMKAEKERADKKKKSKWNVIRLALCDEAFNSTDPDYMTTPEIIEMAEMFREEGQIDSFYRQYMNIPMADENRTFRAEHFKYYEEKDIPNHVENFIIMDPAKTVKTSAADTAIVCAGVDTKNRAFYVRDIQRGKFHPEEMHHKAIDMALAFRSPYIGVEVTGLNEHITSALQNIINQRAAGKLQIIELHARGKKEDRIRQSLGPLYRQGHIYHNPSCCKILEHQLLTFPHSELFDVMDAFSYISEIIELGGRYFDVQETKEEIERDYEGIEEWDAGDKPENDSWIDSPDMEEAI